MTDPSDPASRARAVLDKAAVLADRELPQGYSLEITLRRIGEACQSETIIVYQVHEPEPSYDAIPLSLYRCEGVSAQRSN